MAEQKFYTPLKVGILVVVVSYFLFNLHTTFTLSWVGEWEHMREPFRTIVYNEDISSFVGVVFRFAASIIALATVIAYFIKKNLSKPTVYKVLKGVLVFEGIYWLGLIATAGYGAQLFSQSFPLFRSLDSMLFSLLTGVVPAVVEAIAIPTILFIFAFKLNPNKPFKTVVKWGSITGTIFIFVFWLTNTSFWWIVIQQKGIGYLWSEVTQVNGAQHIIYHPEHLVSFITTAFGLLALAIYAAYFTKKSAPTESLEDLRLGAVGAITLALGMYFLWNYLSWVIFAGTTFNDWYRWFLGHNMDLWLLTLPLVALPLIFYKHTKQTSSNMADSEKEVR